MESAVSTVIKNIIDARSLRVLSDAGRKLVGLFATVQMLRTDAQRKQLKGMIDNVYNTLLRMGADPNKVKRFEFLDEEQTRTQSILSLREIAADLMPHFLDKCWVLYSTTSDNLVLHLGQPNRDVQFKPGPSQRHAWTLRSRHRSSHAVEQHALPSISVSHITGARDSREL